MVVVANMKILDLLWFFAEQPHILFWACEEKVTESLTGLIFGFPMSSYIIPVTNFQLCISIGYRENLSLVLTAEIGIPVVCSMS